MPSSTKKEKCLCHKCYFRNGVDKICTEFAVINNKFVEFMEMRIVWEAKLYDAPWTLADSDRWVD
jgi:hypothetical protein